MGDGDVTRAPVLTRSRARKWFSENYDKHVRATKAFHQLVISLLDQAHIPYAAVTSRTKTLASFMGKASAKKTGRTPAKRPRRKYTDPSREISDVCGVRIVTFVDSLTTTLADLIKKEFTHDPAQYVDKTVSLGIDRVGYRSIHYVVRLASLRRDLAEYRDFADIPFEIQVRSLLQHAWAEFEHDRRFKSPAELPPGLKRRFSLLAGGLELLDGEFDRLGRDVDAHNAALARTPDVPPARPTPLTLDVVSGYLSGLFRERWSRDDWPRSWEHLVWMLMFSMS